VGLASVKLVLATTNTGKLREMGPMLAGTPFELVTLAAWPEIAAPEEPGHTFADNARTKAVYYAVRTGELTVAEDSGLEIDALGGAPGVESARFGGLQTSYVEKFELIYRALEARGALNSQARFICALTLARGTRIIFETCGTIEGQIARPPRGAGGFGYDPIFFYPPFGCTLAEAGARKAEVSHRAQAFRRLGEFLRRERTERHDL